MVLNPIQYEETEKQIPKLSLFGKLRRYGGVGGTLLPLSPPRILGLSN